MDEIDAIKPVAGALEKLNPDEQARVLGWAQAKFGGATNIVAPTGSPVTPPITPPSANNPNTSVGRPPSKAKHLKKAKTIISMDKSLDLAPQGKISASQFATQKSPSNAKQKSVVAVHYLRDVIGLQKVSAQAVFTFFKYVRWPVPANLRNILHQAGTEGWLDTADSEDIKLTSLGENLVDHDLPTKAKTKP